MFVCLFNFVNSLLLSVFFVVIFFAVVVVGIVLYCLFIQFISQCFLLNL